MTGWEWRKAADGWIMPSDRGPEGRAFHAYDVNDHAACRPSVNLWVSVEPVNEGSRLCPDCMEVVRTEPEGRERIVMLA